MIKSKTPRTDALAGELQGKHTSLKVALCLDKCIELETELAEANAKIAEQEKELDGLRWSYSPAMAEAKINELNVKLSALEANIMSNWHDITTEPPSQDYHDAQAVHDFSVEMLKKLLKNSHKAHWSTVDCDYLLDRLIQELEELKAARSGSAKDIISECADVANFAMMIADNAKKGRG